MRVVILGREESWHVQQLAWAGHRLGHDCRVVPFERLSARIGLAGPSLAVGDFDLFSADRVLVRGIPPGSLEQVVVRMDSLHRLVAAGIPVLNPPAAIEACVDKYLALARMAAAGLPVPPTVVCESLDDALDAFHRLGGDVLVKPIFGSEGRGIVRVEDEALAYRVLRALGLADAVFYLQAFIPNEGRDVRLLVLEGEVIATMQRRAAEDFRANVARGGSFERVEPAREWVDLAVRAAKAVGAPLAGVDLLPDRRGDPVLLEVNSVPGFRALAQTTGVDIPGAIFDALMQRSV